MPDKERYMVAPPYTSACYRTDLRRSENITPQEDKAAFLAALEGER